MKKKNLLFLLILLSSCGGEPTQEPTAEPTQQPTQEPTVEPTQEPTVEPTVEPTQEVSTETCLEIIKNCRTFSSVRNFVSIKNGNEKIYEVLHRVQYDSKKNFLLEIYQEKGKNSLDEANPTYQLSTEVYYDGEYSFSLDSDGIYIKEKCVREITAPTNSFNYDVLKNMEVTQNGFRYILTATVDDNDVKTLLNNDISNVTSFNFRASINGDTLENLEFTYIQNNLSVTRTIEYTYYDFDIVFPTTYKTLN